MGPYQFFRLADVEFLVQDVLQQTLARVRLRDREQRAGMPHRKLLRVQSGLHRGGQFQQADEIRDRGAAEPDQLAHLRVRQVVTGGQFREGAGLLQGREIRALNILHQGQHQGILFRRRPHHGRRGVQTGLLGRAPASFARDQHEMPLALRIRLHHQRLEQA